MNRLMITNNFPDFPRTDIDVAAASQIGLMLSNAELLAAFHDMAEQANEGFRNTHFTLLQKVAEMMFPNDPTAMVRFELGVVAMEAMHPLVAASVEKEVKLTLGVETIHSIGERGKAMALVNACEEGLAALYKELPNTVAVLEEATSREVHFSQRTQVLLGAATLRSTILSAA